MIDSLSKRMALLLILCTAMLATRLYHFGSVPDASWALFFISGFYLSSARSFAVLLCAAVTMDYIATQHLGVSSYCLSPAYGFVVPAYAALWFGGKYFHRHSHGISVRSIVPLVFSLVSAVTLCFLLTNGSFYWLSGRTSAPSVMGWMTNFARWYPAFLFVPCAYVGVAAVLHIRVVSLSKRLAWTALHPATDKDILNQ